MKIETLRQRLRDLGAAIDGARTIDDIVSFLDYAGEHPLAASATPTAAPTPSSAEP